MDSLIDQGAELALIGMATVFAFLAALVLAVRAMSALAGPPAPGGARPSTRAAEGEEDPRLAAAAAAVARHRARNGRDAS